jgi:hypothetical protein
MLKKSGIKSYPSEFREKAVQLVIERGYPWLVYTAIIATIAAIPVVIQFFAWLLNVLAMGVAAP